MPPPAADGAVPAAPQVRARQLKLFSLTNPISARIGQETFTRLPASPGVYSFFESTGRLLYIGQSNNLRARVGSYRHVSPERHPRRILRLVHRISRIEWQLCTTAEDAIELERVLLLQHRPPFNRAGTWQPPPWRMRVSVSEPWLVLGLRRDTLSTRVSSSVHQTLALEEADSTSVTGEGAPLTLPRSIYGAIARCLLRVQDPTLALGSYPAGILNFDAPLHLRLFLPDHARELGELVCRYAGGDTSPLLGLLCPLVEVVTEDDLAEGNINAYWAAQVEIIENHALKLERLRNATSEQHVTTPEG